MVNAIISCEIKKTLTSNNLVLFMKGTLSMPLCAKSAEICRFLKKYHIQFKVINLCMDPNMMFFLEKMHKCDNVPFLYHKDQYIGGYNELTNLIENNLFIKNFPNLYENHSAI